MKFLLTISFMLAFAIAKGQVITGRIIDKKTNEPIDYLPIIIHELRRGCFPNEHGYFTIQISKGDTLKISGLGFPTYWINNITTNTDTVNLGELQIVESGFQGYITYTTGCKYVDNTKDIYKEDLSVVCLDGSIRFKWNLRDEKNAFIDFSHIQYCK